MMAERHRPKQPIRDDHVIRVVLVGVILLAIAAAGGASRSAEPQQVFVRLAAIVVLLLTALPLCRPSIPISRRSFLWLAACYGLILIQLLPLPTMLWAVLPGHQAYAQVAETAGSVVWRPISLTPDLTLNALFALLPASAVAVAMVFLREEDSAGAAVMLVAIALTSAALGLAQLAVGDDALHLFRNTSHGLAVGLFANRNHNAFLLSAVLPMVAAVTRLTMADPARRRGAMLGGGACAALLVVGVIAAGSRMGLLTGLLGLAAAAAILSRTAPKRRVGPVSPRGLLIAVSAGIGTVLVAGLLVWRAGLIARFAATDVASESRLQMLGPMARTAGAFMPFGSGFGSFDSVYRQFEPLDLLSTTYMNQAHNEPFQLAIEGGLPALALLALFLWWWIDRVRRALRQPRPLALAAAAGTAILMLASLVDYPLRTPLCSGVFAMLCVWLARPDPALARRHHRIV